MKQEDKELLLKDLCYRLPYGAKFKTPTGFDTLESIDNEGYINAGFEDSYELEEIKPYLFPLSSMTDEQKKFFKYKPMDIDKYGDISAKDDFFGNSQYTDLDMYIEVQDWLNANHFDYRGLIEKGLAIDATKLNIYQL